MFVCLSVVMVLCSGCASIDYVGDSFDPTTHVDVFFSEDDIDVDYRVIGHITAHVSASASVYSGEDLMKKLKVIRYKRKTSADSE